MKYRQFKLLMSVLFLVIFISVISVNLYFTLLDNGITGMVVYDNNPNVEMIIPDLDLYDQYGYSTGHQELTEREDNKFDITLSSSPGIPNLVHVGELPEATIDIYGYDSENASVEVESRIDVLAEDDPRFGDIKTAVFGVDSIEIDNATITLPKTHHVDYVLECNDFDKENFECNDANGWDETSINFIDNGDTITFTVTHFSGYAGGGNNESDSANLTIWDNMDIGMFRGDDEKYQLETIEFFTNYSMLNGSTIGGDVDGSGVTCIINFSNGDSGTMDYIGAYDLYEYDNVFNDAGDYDYNISCDNLLGYVSLNTTDNVTILPLGSPAESAVAPSIDTLVLNSSSLGNSTNENLTVYVTTSDGDNDTIKNITDWRRKGESIAVLNLPIETNGNLNGTDYSTYENNVTNVQAGVTWEPTGGIDGFGTYNFPGNSSTMYVPDNADGSLDPSVNITITTWIRLNQAIADQPTFADIAHKENFGSDGWLLAFRTDLAANPLAFRFDGSAGCVAQWSQGTYFDDFAWHFISATYNGTRLDLYVDGVSRGSDTSCTTTNAGNANSINFGNNFNGSIDEFKLFDEVLGTEQMSAHFNNRTDLIVSQETSVGDNWSVSVTPNDGTQDGAAVYSSGLTILSNAVPIVQVDLNASLIYSNNNINGSALYSDADAEVGTLYFDWWVNDSIAYAQAVGSVANNANVSQMFDTGNFSRGANITLQVTPNDGIVNGTSINSTTITVQSCFVPKDYLNISTDETICPGRYFVNDTSPNGAIDILANNINITCNGTEIYGDGTDYLFWNDGYDNVVIKGCNMTLYDTAITLRGGATSNIIEDNYFGTNDNEAIELGTTTFNIIRNNTIEKKSIGIDGATGGNNNTIVNNTFISQLTRGIDLSGDHNNITNNTFINQTNNALTLDSSTSNSLVWGNRFLDTRGVSDSGTNSNFCVNDEYGNYYDLTVSYTNVEAKDCGPSPNATIVLHSSSSKYNWTWGSTGTTTFNDLREAVYNTESTDTIVGAIDSGTFFKNETDTVRDNVTLDCRGIIFDDNYNGDQAITIQGENGWTVQNCTFISYTGAIEIQSNGDNTTFINNTFLHDKDRGIDIDSDHNNITNNTFYNSSSEGLVFTGTANNNNAWGNRFLGENNDGLNDGGVETNLCFDNLYGNYYDNNVNYADVADVDCGPSPNASMTLHSSSSQYNWTWGSTGTSTFNSLRESVYNTESTDIINGALDSGTFFVNDTDTVRSNITLDCNGIKFDNRYSGEIAIRFRAETWWTVQNCTFIGYTSALDLDTASHNNTFINNTFLNDKAEPLDIDGEHNNITNNTFFNSTNEGLKITSSGENNKVWGNIFLGVNNNDGLSNADTTTDLCVNGQYGNYYNGSVGATTVPLNDCGPSPNATIFVDLNGTLNITWKGNVTVPSIQEGIYNTYNDSSGALLLMQAGSGPYEETVISLRNGITLDCNDTTLLGSGSGNGFQINGERDITIRNCTFDNFDDGVELDNADYNKIYNSTFLNNDVNGVNIDTTSHYNEIKHCNISNNDNRGLFGASSVSTFNNITENTFENNSGFGLSIDTEMDNTSVWRNNFISNNGGDTQADNDDATNVFNVSDTGNYWDDYDEAGEGCTDGNSDGFCDLAQDNISGSGNVNDSWPYVTLINYRAEAAAAATTISACGNISNKGSYQLDQSVNSTTTCINIMASNISFDCQGFTINYSRGGILGYGVNVSSYNNITIQNCKIVEGNITTSSKHGMDFAGIAGNHTIINNNITTIGSNSMGIDLSNVIDSNFSNNIINTNYSSIYAISLGIGSNRNNIQGNTITGDDVGLILSSADNNNITSNTFTMLGTSSNGAIYITSSTGTNLTSNSFNTTFGYPFYIAGNNVAHYDHSIDTTNTERGSPIYYHYGNNSGIINGLTDVGSLIVANATNMTISSNILDKDGILLLNTTTSLIYNNTITTNYSGIILEHSTSNQNNVTWNTVTIGGASAYGVGLGDGADHNTIENNIITTTGTGTEGIYIGVSNSGSDDNNITNNTIVTYGASYATGIHIVDDSNRIMNNTVKANVSPAIYISTGLSNYVSNNSFESNDTNVGVVYLDLNANLNTITQNNISGSSRGLGISRSTDNLISLNSINWSTGIEINTNSENNTIINNRIDGSSNQMWGSGAKNNSLVYNNTFGKINWTDSDIDTGMDLILGETIFLLNNTVGIADDSGVQELNGSAQIEMKNLGHAYTPWLMKNGIRCDNETTCNTSYDSTSKILYANISSFSNYTTRDDPSKSCGFVDSDLNLTENLTSIATCLQINGSNVVIDCQGYFITGNSSDDGIVSAMDNNNIIIKNCNIRKFRVGITIQDGDNYTIYNNTIADTVITYDKADGIAIINTTSFNISSNTIFNLSSTAEGGAQGIYIVEKTDGTCANSIIANNFIYNMSGDANNIPKAIEFGDSSINSLRDIVIENNLIENISCTDTTPPSLCEQHVGGIGIQLITGKNITVNNNSIQTSGSGFYISGSAPFAVNNNTLTSNFHGISYGEATGPGVGIGINHTILINNTFNSNTFGISLRYDSYNNTFQNNIFTSNTITINDTSNMSNELSYENSFGIINWTKTNISTDTDINIGEVIFLENNIVGLNESNGLLELNTSSKIEIKGLGYGSTPFLNKSGIRCDNETICNVSYNAGTGVLSANVSSFSNYTTTGSNTAPTVTLSLTPAIAYTNNPLTVNVSYADVDNDVGTIYFDWWVNGTPTARGSPGSLQSGIPAGTNASHVLTSDYYNRWANVTIQATAFDGTVNGTSVNTSINISNSVPDIAESTLIPVTAYTNNTLNITIMYSDIDFDVGIIYFDWFVNNTWQYAEAVNSVEGDTNASVVLNPDNFTRWSNVTIQITPYDGTVNGTAINKSINITNLQAFVNSTTIYSPDNCPTTPINGTSMYNDEDIDSGTIYFEWFVDNTINFNEIITSQTPGINASRNLSADNFTIGNVVKLQTTVFDGIENGSATNSSSITIVSCAGDGSPQAGGGPEEDEEVVEEVVEERDETIDETIEEIIDIIPPYCESTSSCTSWSRCVDGEKSKTCRGISSDCSSNSYTETERCCNSDRECGEGYLCESEVCVLTDQCTDSDGRNIYSKGEVILLLDSKSETNEDSCIDESNVLEYMCQDSSSVTRESFSCENGCEDGKCIECVPEIECGEWGNCEEVDSINIDPRDTAPSPTQTRTCYDLNRCTEEYTETQSCCPDGIIGKAFGSCEFSCEPSRNCERSECERGMIYETCIYTDEKCVRTTELVNREECAIDEDIEKDIEETIKVIEDVENERDYKISDEHKTDIVDEALEYLGIQEDWISEGREIDVTLEEEDSSINEHTTTTIRKLELDHTSEESREYMGNLEEDTSTGQLTSLPYGHIVNTITVEDRETNEEKTVSSITVVLNGEDEERKAINNLRVIEYIPREIAKTREDIAYVGLAGRVIESGPNLIIEWDVGTIDPSEKKEFTYLVRKKVKSVETVAIVTGEYKNKIARNSLPCTRTTYSETKKPVTTIKSDNLESMPIVIDEKDEIIVPAFNVKCDGDNIDFTLNVPENYGDIKILKCSEEECITITQETVSELECGKEIIREKVIEEQYVNFIPIEAEQVEINIEEFKNAISNIENNINYYDDKEVTITSINEEASQPSNPNLKIVGASVKLRPKKNKIKVTLPFIENSGFNEGSYGIYIKIVNEEYDLNKEKEVIEIIGKAFSAIELQEKINEDKFTWKYIGGEINNQNKVITVEIEDVNEYLDENKEIEVAVMGLLCLNCNDAELKKVYDPKYKVKNAVILIHGLASSPATYEHIIKDIKMTDQPFQAWIFGYPTTREIIDNAKDLANQLEKNQEEFENVYIAAHSLGGIISQQALYYAEQENLKTPGKFKFINKVRSVVAIGTPNEGIPIGPYKKLFQHIIDLKTKDNLFDMDNELVQKLSKGLITPQVEGIEYYVIAGDKPYPFSSIFFEKELGREKVIEANDGIVGVKSAQNIGGEYKNNECVDFWQLSLTHTELLDNPIGRKQIEKIVSQEVLEETDLKVIMGKNQFYQFHISECNEDDMYIAIGKKLEDREVIDYAGCKCGDDYCAWYEDNNNCPSDCPELRDARVLGKGTVFGIIALLIISILVLVGSAGYAPYRVYIHILEKKMRTLHFKNAKKENLGMHIEKLSEKMHIDKIKEKLIKKGWNKHVVEHHIKQHNINILGQMRDYATKMINKGVEPIKLREHLISKGWHHSHVDKILGITPVYMLSQMRDYSKQRLEKGHDKITIRKDLIKKGWSPQIIDRSLGIDKEDGVTILKQHIDREVKNKRDIDDIEKSLIKKGWNKGLVKELTKRKKILSLNRLREYVKKELIRGESPLKIKHMLVEKHWDKKTIDNLLSMTHKVGLSVIIHYVRQQKGKGKSVHEIRENLINKGWNHKSVDNLLNISGKEGIDKGLNYIKKQLDKGADPQQIRSALIKKGWSVELVNKLLKTSNMAGVVVFKDYLHHAHEHDHDIQKVKKELVISGWDNKIIEQVTKHIKNNKYKTKIKTLIEYVIIHLKTKEDPKIIRKILIKKGWNKEIVDKVVKIGLYDIKKKKLNDLSKYIYKMIKEGHRKKQVVELLISKGWSMEAIKKAMKKN